MATNAATPSSAGAQSDVVRGRTSGGSATSMSGGTEVASTPR